MTRKLTRRTFNTMVGTAIGAASVFGPWVRRAAAAGEVTVLNWRGYGTDEAFGVRAFAEATGITVRHDYFTSEPEMLTKLRTNPGAYDVVLINSARTQQAQGEGLVAPIDFGMVPNAGALAAPLRSHANLMAGGRPYGVAWVWGMNSLAVRRGRVTDAASWATVIDPRYVGRLALLDDAVTEIGIGALLNGMDINNPRDLAAVKASLKAMKPNVKLLWSSEDQWNRAFAADAFDISVYWSGAAVRANRRHNLAVDFVVPREGAIGWLDGLSIPAASRNKEGGLKFINYMIDPTFYVTWATTAGAPASANTAAMDRLPADDLSRQVHKTEYLANLQLMGPLPDDRRQAFNDIWEEVKAFYAS